jgi:hypothetical protein
MITRVLIRDGHTGLCRDGQAYTAGDAPAGLGPLLVVTGKAVAPDNGTVVVVRPMTEPSVVMELLAAGYAVQVRAAYWPPEE